MAKSKLIEEVIQDDVQLSEEVVAQVEKAKTPKDIAASAKVAEVDKYPGHTRRDFRN